MKKLMLVAGALIVLSGCVQPQTPPEDAKLRQAYSACINTAEGSPDKLHACQAVLAVLKQEKQHQQFAEQETVRVLDYQRCIQAVHTGDGQAYEAKCGKVWQEIRANNH
ncbi:ChiQ/YbfN family lipoprotein [Serratia sp. NPDC078593]|uniref:ChiQ/YbfN family lipoprotein n=1 Tax=unclassified Serratia (in: enterobacteria) TaxID=2647522 RepID=UPI0037D1FBC6